MYDGKYDFKSSFYMDLYQDLLDRYNSQLDYYCLDEKITRFIGLVQKESYLYCKDDTDIKGFKRNVRSIFKELNNK